MTAMRLASKQIVDLVNEMVNYAEKMARHMREGIGPQDIERLRCWRDVIAQQVMPQCAAVCELDAAIDAAPKVDDFRENEPVAVVTLYIALRVAVAAGALLEVARRVYFEELFGE